MVDKSNREVFCSEPLQPGCRPAEATAVGCGQELTKTMRSNIPKIGDEADEKEYSGKATDHQRRTQLNKIGR